MAADAIPVLPPVVRGTVQQLQIPSCLLTPNDLRRLYRTLEQKAAEAADRQVATLTLQAGQTQEQLDALRNQVRTALTLVLRVQTGSGEWVGGTTVDPLSDEQLPSHIVKIELDSSFLYRSQFHLAPNNTFTVTLDFSRPGILDMSNVPVANVSVAIISGLDATWAHGLHNELITFFRERPTKRGWLHFSQSHSVLVILVGFPLSFDAVYHLAPLMRKAALPDALAVALYVYVVLVVLFLFRITFNYARWAFPKVEINAPRQHVATAHRLAISAVALMIVSALVRAGLKLLGIG